METPATRILQKFGGDYSEVAKVAGVDVSRVHRWTYPKDRGGTDGKIPQKHWRKLIDGAREKGIQITTQDLLPSDLHTPKAATQ